MFMALLIALNLQNIRILYYCKNKNFMEDKIRQHTYMQFIVLGIVLMVGSLVFTALAFGFSSLIWGMNDTLSAMDGVISSQNDVNILKIIQLASQLAIFIVPPLVLWKIMRKTNPNYLGLSHIPTAQQFLIVIGLFIVSIPFLQYMIMLNESMSLGESLSGLEAWMREQQDKNDFITEKFLQSVSYPSLFVNLIIMAVMPAIGEELFFRGVLMSWFKKLTSNIHINIIITSIIFSAIHMQFYGFIPRFLLGMALGYTYYWTASLWAPILLHFVNNAITVFVYFYVNSNNISQDPQEFGTVESIPAIVFSAVSIGLLMYLLYKSKNKEIVGVP